MKFLMEHEMAFDADCLGFPSIQGCHAIVYQTTGGIYGFHVAGGSANDDWPLNAGVFRQFINDHGGLASPGSRLYGASFIENNQRGYSGAKPKQRWIEELVTFSSALGYTGKISGYDLFKSLGADASAYVEYRVNGSKCDLYIRKWSRDNDHPTVTDNPDQNIHKVKHKVYGQAPTLKNLDKVVSGVSRDGVTHVHKEKLR